MIPDKQLAGGIQSKVSGAWGRSPLVVEPLVVGLGVKILHEPGRFVEDFVDSRPTNRGDCLHDSLRTVVLTHLTHFFPPFQHLLSERLRLSA